MQHTEKERKKMETMALLGTLYIHRCCFLHGFVIKSESERCKQTRENRAIELTELLKSLLVQQHRNADLSQIDTVY